MEPQTEPQSYCNRLPRNVDLSEALVIFEATPNPYLILNPKLEIVAVNDAYLRATSTIRGKILGRGIFDVFPDNPHDPMATGVKNLKASLERVIKTKCPDRMAIQKYDVPIPGSMHEEFEERYWSPLNTPVLNERRELIYIIHHVEDVTHTTELEKSEAQFRQIANTMPQSVWIVKPRGTVNWANDWWYEYTGAERNAESISWKQFVHEEDLARYISARDSAIERKVQFSLDVRVRSRTGEYRWHWITLRPVAGESGKLLEWVGIMIDIHELALAKEKIQEAEERFRTITNAVPQIVWSTLADGYHDYFNDRYYEFTGAPAGSMHGDDWIVFHHPDERARLKEAWNRSLATGDPYEIEYRMRHHTGEWRWVLGRALPVKNKEGRVIRWFGTCTDIHDQKKTLEALEESEAKFRTITNALPQIVWSAHPNGGLDYFNDRYYEFTGLPKGSMTGDQWFQLVHPEDKGRTLKDWEHSLATGERYEVSYRVKHHSGSYRWLLARALPIRNKEGKIVRWFGTSTDIHEQIQTQSALNEAIQDREMFFSIASHELKTPLTALGLQTQLQLQKLKKSGITGFSEADLVGMMEKINQQTGKLVRLADEMLDVSRITSGKLKLDLTDCNLCELLEEVISRTTPEFQKAEVPIPHLTECEGARGQWDQLRIEQVITNLLTNALRYGNGKPITVRVKNFETMVRLTVQDEGIGISEEDKETIFSRFERATARSKRQGLGLGLYITKEIVLAHGGKIWVDSVLGQGSTFNVELPLKPQ